MGFEETLTSEKASFSISEFDFEYQDKWSADTSLPNFISDCNTLLDSQGNSNQKIVFIISDGWFNKKNVIS